MPGTAALPGYDAKIQAKVDYARTAAHAKVQVRPFRVHREKWTWSGTERGAGTATLTTTVELTNDVSGTKLVGGAPAVTDERGRPLSHEGAQRAGKVWLRELSLTYLESEVLGAVPAANEEVFFRLADNLGHGMGSLYFVRGETPPRRNIADYEWIVELRAAEAPTP